MLTKSRTSSWSKIKFDCEMIRNSFKSLVERIRDSLLHVVNYSWYKVQCLYDILEHRYNDVRSRCNIVATLT